MRAYIDGTLSVTQNCFLPASIWFYNPDEGFNEEISYKCIRLDGLEVEGGVEGTEFGCRWKGVELCYTNEDGEYIETENFTFEDLTNLIETRKLSEINMDAYYDTNVKAKITKLKLVNGDKSFEFNSEDLNEIEFIAQ